MPIILRCLWIYKSSFQPQEGGCKKVPFGKLGWCNGIMFHKISIVMGYEMKVQTLQTYSSSWETSAPDIYIYMDN